MQLESPVVLWPAAGLATFFVFFRLFLSCLVLYTPQAGRTVRGGGWAGPPPPPQYMLFFFGLASKLAQPPPPKKKIHTHAHTHKKRPVVPGPAAFFAAFCTSAAFLRGCSEKTSLDAKGPLGSGWFPGLGLGLARLVQKHVENPSAVGRD
jgi:hypothetical protein